MDDNSRRAEQAARRPVIDGTTGSGLPRRPPQANLLPGAAAQGFGAARELPVSREPEEIRSRLERFANGRELARMEDDPPELPPNPMTAASPLASSPVNASPLPTPPPGSLSPLPKGWDRPWGNGWRSFRPGS